MKEEIKLIEQTRKHRLGKIKFFQPQNEFIKVNGRQEKKIELIMDVFGVKEWISALKNELGINESEGVQGISKIISSPEMNKRYKDLRDNMALMAKERVESDAGYATNA